MMVSVPEADWRAFRELRETALQRFCRRALEEIQRVCQDDSRSWHERYTTVYRWLEDRDAELARAFDDPRRSTMLAQLATLVALSVIERDEMVRFTSATREAVELLCGVAEKSTACDGRKERLADRMRARQERIGVAQAKQLAYQFKVTLRGVVPQVWRRIVVPGSYSFWDLHVAIQDSMGWLDCHLHAFRVRDARTGAEAEIGIPDPDGFDVPARLPGWEVPLAGYFSHVGDVADYEYDFGDGWEHEVLLEEVAPRRPKTRYPMCLDGARACPPEDCGGASGYAELLKVLSDPTHEEHEQMLEWVGGRLDPAEFDRKRVRFDNPSKRWRAAFQSEEL